jgi:hypothetical protein
MSALTEFSSREYDLDREIEDLIAKVVHRTATPEDMARYRDLSRFRSELLDRDYSPAPLKVGSFTGD